MGHAKEEQTNEVKGGGLNGGGSSTNNCCNPYKAL